MMHITTFYSFKGGVGRSMALANVATHLALRGQKVLVVDFDLEAPGLDTFNLLKPKRKVPGIIDYTSEYLQNGEAPKAKYFIGEATKFDDTGGSIWIMPSGRKDDYRKRFNQIDWRNLYNNHNGYLLFEDLKEQWKNDLNPDYVLIDSRTGHTDTGGICTRHLPDSVVIQFFPNKQNLLGLEPVVKGIRTEKSKPPYKDIFLHFVMSNVPFLDDEDRILEKIIGDFKSKLDFQNMTRIHRYDSLLLLKQTIFTKERPNSRLAKEFVSLAEKISMENPYDRYGALGFIKKYQRPWRSGLSYNAGFDEKLKRIENIHNKDGEILYNLGKAREMLGEPEIAEDLFKQAIKEGYDNPEAYLKRAFLHLDGKNIDGFKKDIKSILDSPNANPPTIRLAIKLLNQKRLLSIIDIIDSVAIKSLENRDKLWLASTLNQTPDELQVSKYLFEELDVDNIPEKYRFYYNLGLIYIGLGHFDNAITIYRPLLERDKSDIVARFNYSMAIWGKTGKIPVNEFELVVELDGQNIEFKETANYCQCMSLAYFAVKNKKKAMDYLNKAEELNISNKSRIFSCWQFLEVSWEVFNEDLKQIFSMINGNQNLTPIVINQ